MRVLCEHRVFGVSDVGIAARSRTRNSTDKEEELSGATEKWAGEWRFIVA